MSIVYVKLSKLSKKDHAYYNKLRQFYTNARIRKILPYINSTSKTLSLRIFDWFSTNYSRDKKLILYANDATGKWTDRRIKHTTTTKFLRVSSSYKNALRGYTKKYFDPFKRTKNMGIIKYRWGGDNQYSFDTTLAQLIYFRWILENNLLEYIIDNRDKIINHYKKYHEGRGKTKK